MLTTNNTIYYGANKCKDCAWACSCANSKPPCYVPQYDYTIVKTDITTDTATHCSWQKKGEAND